MRFLKASSELHDGVSSTIIEPNSLQPGSGNGIIDSLLVFLNESEVGDEVTFTVVEMDEAEYERLPEI